MSYGSAIHQVLPMLLQGSSVEEALKTFNETWTSELDDPKRNIDRAKAVLEDFAGQHSGERSIYKLVQPPKTSIQYDRRSPYEVPFVLDLGVDRPLVGWLDGIGRHRDTGELYAIEFKTTSQKGSWFTDSLTFNPQIIGYPLALTTILDEPVRGTMVETLYVSSRETATFLKPYDVAEWQIDEFVSWARLTIKQIIAYTETGQLPKNPAACSTYPMFGTPGYVCEFGRLCHITPEWETYLETYDQCEERTFLISNEQPKP
jgi:hypothetical protein